MTRPIVYLSGWHNTMGLVRSWLIKNGYELTDYAGGADYHVFGGHVIPPKMPNLPTLVLSSSDIYWSSASVDSFSEDSDLIIPPTRDTKSLYTIRCAASEASAFREAPRTLALRTFNVYGKDIHTGIIHDYLVDIEKQQPLNVPLPGYQERTFLFQEDFINFFSILWDKFVSGLSGIYNVGHETPVNLHRAADITWQRTNGVPTLAPVTLQPLPFSIMWRVAPDMTRTHAETGYKATTSLSAGIWKMHG